MVASKVACSRGSQSVLRWGIVAAAKIGHDFVNAFNSYPQQKGQVVAAIAARDINRAKEFAKMHNIKHVYDSYEAMAKSKEIDVAYVASVNPFHYKLAKMYLDNGIHVLCEKPLCMNYKQVKSLVDFAREKNLFLMEAVLSRSFPLYHAMRKELNECKIGDVMYVEANIGIPLDFVERISKKELGGSIFLDIGVYVLQLAQFVFQEEPIKVTTTGVLNEHGVDMIETVVLEYCGEKRAILNVHGKLLLWNKATIVGTQGRISIKDPFHCPTVLIHADGKEETFPLPKGKLHYNFHGSEGLVYEALEAKRCIEQGLIESPNLNHKESLLFAKIEDEIRRQLGVTFDADTNPFC